MSRLWVISAAAALGLGGLGCSGSAPIETARQAWKRSSESCPTYHYAITDASFTGFSSRTTIAISGGQPIARAFVSSELVAGSPSTRVVTSSWTEAAGHVGEHTEGRPAKTMEQLYDDCAKNVLTQDPAKNEVRFEADARGVLLQCWYVPKGCQDDCSMGVVVEDFACGVFKEPDGGLGDSSTSDGDVGEGDAGAADAPDALTDTSADTGADTADAACAPNPLFVCVTGVVGGSCGDTGRPGVCVGGDWTCPPGTIPPQQCGPCSGTPPPPTCRCTATGWVCPDAATGG